MMVGMGRLVGQLAVAVCIAPLAGCLGGESLGDHSSPAGSGGTGAASATGGVLGTGGLGAGGEPFCGTINFVGIAPVPPDILIVMDRSSSMNDDSNEMSCAGGCGASSKWALATAAIDSLVSANPTVNWGLVFYGSDDSCDAAAGAAVEVGPGSGPAIHAALAATVPGGEAPAAAAINNGASYLTSLTDGSPKYILLVTDGRSGCGGSDGAATAAAEAAIVSATVDGVPTFVAGLAPEWDTTAVAALNQMAVNGNEPQQGTATSYYAVADLALFGVHEVSSRGCAFPLPLPSGPVAGNLAVSATMADGSEVPIPESSTSGWSFTDSTCSSVELHGPACEAELHGSYTGVTIAYRCGEPDPPQLRRSPPPGR
jgi:hypothetical protein